MVYANTESVMKCVNIEDSGYLHSLFNKFSESSKENIRILSQSNMDSYKKFISDPIGDTHSNNKDLLIKCDENFDLSKFKNHGAFDLMKKLINCDSNIDNNSETNHTHQLGTNSLPPKHSYKKNSIAPKVHAEESFDVTETYQLGFRSNATKKSSPDKVVIHFPICIEAMEVSYPVSGTINDSGIPQVPVDYPPILLGEDKRKDLSSFVMQSLTMICDYVDSFYTQREEEEKAAWIGQQLDYDAEIVFLRKQAFCLLLRLLPDLNVIEYFDCTSPHLEVLLDCICQSLKTNNYEDRQYPVDKLTISPRVVLHRDCRQTLQILKQKIFDTLSLMIPNLNVPESFSVEADLNALLECIFIYA